VAQLGNSVTPTSGWDWPGSGYAFASQFTAPSGAVILISAIHAYFATPSGASTGYVCVWDGSSGALLTSINIGALPGGSQSAGGQSWQVGTLGTPLPVAGGTSIWIGGYGTGNVVFSSGSGGSSNVKSLGGGGPGSFAGSGASSIGIAGAYVDYSIGQIYYGDPSGNGVPHSIVAVWYGDPSGNGVPHKAAGVWVPTGGPPPTGVKRVW
jgi:hypothetical protein